MAKMPRKSITIDQRCQGILNSLVPDVYPSESEAIRDLLRKEEERRGTLV